jgi:RNA polymerase sigma factor (sigma-70 family)
MVESTPVTVADGDLGELYGLLARRLERIVRLDVHAPDVVIEDACQFAWTRLLHHRDHVHRDTVMSWLIRTAVHEAFKVLRRDRRELSLEAEGEDAMLGSGATRRADATLSELIECRERLAELGRLPERQQRAIWLHAAGLNYGEIARYEGCTIRTVERQLLRARHAIRQPKAA